MRKFFTLSALILAFACGLASAQDRQISGKVISSQDNLGIPGVTVIVVGSSLGASTDIDGNYTLSIPPSAKMLRFSGIGMKTKEVPVGASNVIDLVMDPDVMKLDEVVVTAVGIKREKRSLGYATKQVSSEELNAGNQSSFISALSGKVNGANITSSTGAPGGSTRITLRGQSSIGQDNNALIVIDGVPVNNANNRNRDGTGVTDDLNNAVDYGNRGADINPDDIESISVLEGPAAAALYGSAASNGAVMITTKKGYKTTGGPGKMSIAFSTGVSFATPLKTPTFQNQYGQGDLHGDPTDRRENFSWGLPFDGEVRPWGQQIDIDGDGTLDQRVKPYSAVENNVRDFFETGVTYNNQLSFTGGGEKSTFYLSLGAINDAGMIPTTTYNKYNVLANATSEISKTISAAVSIGYTNISSQRAAGGQRDASFYNQIIQTPRDINLTELADLNNPFNNYDDNSQTYGFYGGYTVNPYFSLANYQNFNHVDRVIGNVSVSWTPAKWIKIDERLGADIYSDRREQKHKKYFYKAIDPFWDNGATDQTNPGRYSQDVYNQNNLTNDLIVTLSHKLSDDLNVSLLLGSGVLQNKTERVFGATNEEGGLSLPGYYNLVNSNGQPIMSNSLTQRRVISYYGSLDFQFKQMLFLSITGRNDKSSTLPVDKQSYFYPGASLSWVFSELMSKDQNSFLSFGKIRLSYAKVGKDANPYLLYNTYSHTTIENDFGSTVMPFGTVDGYTVGDLIGNPNITPEFTKTFEAGAELSFLNERLGLDFTYYKANSTDQIVPINIPNSSGGGTFTTNIGEVENKGFEIGIKAVVVSTKDFTWSVNAGYATNDNKVLSLAEGVSFFNIGGTSRTGIVAAVGLPMGQFYAQDLVRDPQGRVVIDSATGSPVITTDAQLLGTYLPDYTANFGTTLTYKNWSFGILFDTKQGGYFSSRTKDLMDFVGTAQETAENGRDPRVWPNSVYQSTADAGGYVANSDITYDPYDYFTGVIPDGQHIVDASYVKLREMHLTYTFPSKWLKRSPFGSASLSFYGNNLAIWTPDENQYSDPEMNSSGSGNAQGFDFTALPSQRNYGFNLKVTF